jgi:acetyl esterase
MTLAPEIAKFLEIRAESGLPEVWQAPVEILRANTYARLVNAGIPEKIFSVANRFIPGPTADLPIRVYRPSNAKNLPALVFFHGGGWVLGFLDLYDAALHSLANKTGSVIISVNYQKAPEHPYPTAFDDCFATLLWVSTNSFELGIDQTKIGVGGDSAGANLASAVALKARDRGVLKLAYQLLFYPCNERDFETPSYLAYANGFGLPRKSMQWFWEQYLQGGDHDSDPYACPSRAKDFSNLAPAIIVTAEYDPLKDDGVKYERLLKGAGVPTSYLEYKGMIHGFVNLSAITPTAQRAIAECAKRIQTLLR